ncbi:uncharacterized protein LOC123322595 [Coccinella septempunctata]|uniref:uncharacterized protein LOC123322595 n=1 Tax=Coccinella septempunctata TaxID=41139 RepID=UPI001D06155C|nr:uncharacterized protein LOC123322595 [Coccinella septempunctata]
MVDEEIEFPVRWRKSSKRRPQSAREQRKSNAVTKLGDTSNFQTSKSAGRLKTKQILRQNSSAIRTDTSGAAIQTINNILNGITESVNRLTELQYTAPDKTQSGHFHTVKLSRKTSEVERVLKPPVVKIRSLRKKVKALSSKLSPITSSWSNLSLKYSGRMSGKVSDKKVQKEKTTTVERMNTETVDASSSAPVKKKLKPYTKTHVDRHYGNVPGKPFEFSPHKLVEIYHNNAAKESDSEEEKNRSKIHVKVKSDGVPHIKIPCHDCGDCKETKNCNHLREESYEEPNAPRAFYANKSYELPTIASKMKQAVKLDFNMFNFKAIPFCPVSSTTPSHNIGINIQQVMSIIKTRQPVQGISPTLAHNINLAAEKLNHDPLTSFVSSMTSKMGYGRSVCPLNKYSLNYRHLEEMARTVPEEATDECDVGNDVGGPSGDMQARAPPGPSQWTTDNNKRNCTCAPATGVDFHQVYNKYRNQPSSFDNKNHYPRHPPNTAKSFVCNESMSRRMRPTSCVDGRLQQAETVYMQDNVCSGTPLNGKEKNLKDVLMNLHDDFDAMNKRYETLSNQVAAGEGSKEAVDELQELESQLNKKEEEITIVMTLYKEVLALKQQVKELTRRSAENNAFRQYRPEDYSSKTAQHITKLLQQIQQYHTYYRNGQNGYLNM